MTRLSSSSPVVATTRSAVSAPAVFQQGRFARVPGDQPHRNTALQFGHAVVVDVDQSDLVVGGGEHLGDLGAEASGTGDDDVHVPSSLSRKPRSLPSAVAATANVTRSPACAGVPCEGIRERPPRVTSTTRTSPSTSNSASHAADEVVRHLGADQQRLPVAETEFWAQVAVQQHLVDLVHGPTDAGDGGNAEFAVDVGAPGVVDAGEDVRHPVGLLRRARADDVAVVPGGDGDEGVRVLDTGGLEHGAAVAVALVEADARAVGQPPGRLGPPVDDLHVVPFRGEQSGEGGAHASAADDDHLHRETPFRGSVRRRSHHLRTSSAMRGRVPSPASTAQSAASSGAVLKTSCSGGT